MGKSGSTFPAYYFHGTFERIRQHTYPFCRDLVRDISDYIDGHYQEKILITDIALEVGFSESSCFIKTFREETGITPKQFIKMA